MRVLRSFRHNGRRFAPGDDFPGGPDTPTLVASGLVEAEQGPVPARDAVSTHLEPGVHEPTSGPDVIHRPAEMDDDRVVIPPRRRGRIQRIGET